MQRLWIIRLECGINLLQDIYAQARRNAYSSQIDELRCLGRTGVGRSRQEQLGVNNEGVDHILRVVICLQFLHRTEVNVDSRREILVANIDLCHCLCFEDILQTLLSQINGELGLPPSLVLLDHHHCLRYLALSRNKESWPGVDTGVPRVALQRKMQRVGRVGSLLDLLNLIQNGSVVFSSLLAGQHRGPVLLGLVVIFGTDTYAPNGSRQVLQIIVGIIGLEAAISLTIDGDDAITTSDTALASDGVTVEQTGYRGIARRKHFCGCTMIVVGELSTERRRRIAGEGDGKKLGLLARGGLEQWIGHLWLAVLSS
mmetsp:Transcript_2171/g.6323  ORF Transcript_2171/g.6323 Transcript_2171/m.6323 type:complete len:314 (-) Transcript_2171:50-991(-)